MAEEKTGEGDIVLGQKGNEDPPDSWNLFVGTTDEGRRKVKLNAATPHVIFVCGARGSGKSYTLGVIAEEIAKKNPDIATVIVDPIGIFWSMKYPNQEDGEIELLRSMGMDPEGVEDVEIFIPKGYSSDVPDETYDSSFSFQVGNLLADDWCLTFGMDRYGPQGLLLERAIEKVKSGYTRELGDNPDGGSRDVSAKEAFSIDDLLECINHDRELLSKEKGFKSSTRRALTSRLSAAKDWGIFGEEKKLSDFVNAGTITVIDISFLSENIGALVLGMLARKILSARKAAAREEAVKDLGGEDRGDSGPIPPTWLMIDEAHSYVPSSGKTAATEPLVEYVKQGRRPGLSAVLSTQQPSALNSKIISQLDILLSHRLSFEDDIKEVRKRVPTTLSGDLDGTDTVKNLPEGTAIAADKDIGRTFFTSIRPRLSQHEGRERVKKRSPTESKGEKSPDMEIEIEEKEVVSDDSEEMDDEFEVTKESRGDEILASPFYVGYDEALEIAESERRRLFKILWRRERIERVSKRYYPIWSVLMDYYPEDGDFMNLRVYLDGLNGELIKKGEGRLERTEGLRKVSGLDQFERKVLFEILGDRPVGLEELKKSANLSGDVEDAVSSLRRENLVETVEDEEGKVFLDLKDKVDIPASLSEPSLLAVEDVPDPNPVEVSPWEKEANVIEEDDTMDTLEFFGEFEVLERGIFYYPYWIAELAEDGKSRVIAIDGIFGVRDPYAERMLRRRSSRYFSSDSS